MTFDRARLPSPLAMDQGESSWLCAELDGKSDRGPRRLAVLAWLHRTGPRLTRLDAGPGLLDKNQLPAVVRELVPSWLPIVTPVRIRSDDRPLLMVALFDLDHPERAPMQVEEEIEHGDFDESTFSGATPQLSLRAASDRVLVEARTRSFTFALDARLEKAAVAFGAGGCDVLRHGDIEIGYLQRPRLSLRGEITVDGERIHGVTGAGAHDRHWRWTSHSNLAWLWLHLRLGADREVNAYVLRDAKTHAEIGRGCWVIDGAAHVRAGEGFELERERESEYRFSAVSLELDLRFGHAVSAPYLAMRAFGSAIAGGIAEGPIRLLESRGAAGVAGWLEVFDSRTCKVT